MKYTLIVPLCLVLAAVRGSADDHRIGVWNIEKLSTTASRGFPELQGASELDPRTDMDLETIGKYLRNEVKIDAVIVTEIEADAADSTEAKPRSAQLNRIVDVMGNDWRYFLGRSGGKLRMGLLYNISRIKLKKITNLTATEFEVEGEDVFDRDPFVLWLSLLEQGAEKNDLFLIGLHLKSQQQFIHNRMAAIAKVLGDLRYDATRAAIGLPSTTDEDDIIIVGDCNDSSHRYHGFKFMCEYLEGSGFTHLGPEDDTYPPTRVNGSQIDHIYVSNTMLDTAVDAGSFQVHLVPSTDRFAYRKTYSDHFPVTLEVRAHDDDD